MTPDAEGFTEEQIAAFQARRNGTAAEIVPFTDLSVADLRSLPPARWLIDRLLVASAFAVIYGASGTGKSFVALDLALTVATGTTWWQGRETEGGWVMFVSAEGSAGLTKRIDAWREDRDQPEPERIRFVTDAPNLLDAHDRARILATIESIRERSGEPLACLVIDTMARTMVGGDENASRDVGQFIAAVDQLRAAAGGCTALVVHHTGKRGDDERGSSALRGAADQMLSLSGEIDGTLQLSFDKLKDFEPPDPILLHAPKVGDSRVPKLGGSGHGSLTRTERRVLERLSELDGSDRPSVTRLAAICEMPERTYHRALASLRGRGFIAPEHEGRAVFNALTEQGRKALLP